MKAIYMFILRLKNSKIMVNYLIKKLEELIAGSRIEVSDNKKNTEDFVLWKPSNENEPSWDSPWGKVGQGGI
jgi:cysteinyl-tRNA synthetase